ncbi:hypothetical protein QR98_0008720 [Sarcoptes scabiei]|uniref:Uncharacterized protein n=1 Tax=Sarcoptes scabiei TaxID=52283 RepID=A0A131ZUJ2_SARSC|nr:hypothetical protein QR98_0008720 [Sarcoptes scabiei]
MKCPNLVRYHMPELLGVWIETRNSTENYTETKSKRKDSQTIDGANRILKLYILIVKGLRIKWYL